MKIDKESYNKSKLIKIIPKVTCLEFFKSTSIVVGRQGSLKFNMLWIR